MPDDLADLDQAAVRRGAARDEAGCLELLAVLVVELLAVAVALDNFGDAVRPAACVPGMSLQG